MSGIFLSHQVRPDELAATLDLWALRREKVLAMIDVRAAKQARRLARTCRVLAEIKDAPLMGDSWGSEWDRTLDEASALLDTAFEAGAPSQRVTRTFDVAALVDDEECPTRVVPTAWLLEEHDRVA